MRFFSLFALATSVLVAETSALVIGPEHLHTRTLPPTWRFDDSGHFNLTLPNDRWALVHVNPKYDNSKAHPLVLAFHGASAGAENMEVITNLSNDSLKINGLDYVAVYGQGTVGTNEGNDWLGAPYASGADDIAYVHNILAAVRGNLSIDATRVYAVGFSNGGGFTNLLACTASTAPLFAAFATSSPALYPGTHGMDLSTCDSGGHPVALIDFHGLSDGVVPYDGREDGNRSLPDIDAWRQGWAQRAGCAAPKNGAQFASSTTASNYLGQNATQYRWNCPKATILGYTVQSMGHYWLSAGGGYWDVTSTNIMAFFSARTITYPF